MKIDEYRSYRDIPPIAGICSMAEAARPGLSVEQSVARLKRCHFALKRLHHIFIARLTSEPVYELKMAFSLHGYYCAEHVAALRKRVGEMREPPLGLDAVPDKALELFFDEILCSPATPALLVGAYEIAVPSLIRAFDRHAADSNRLVDHPSHRVVRAARAELLEMRDYGAAAIASLVDAPIRAALESYTVRTLAGKLTAEQVGRVRSVLLNGPAYRGRDLTRQVALETTRQVFGFARVQPVTNRIV